MQYSLALLAFAAAVSASPAPQEAPGAATDCKSSYDGSFQIEVVNTTSTKRSLAKRQNGGPLILTLADGILKDARDRIGYIASNNQFQFDNPVQEGTIYASGWAVCSDGTLVLGQDSVFQQCLSGTFYNLYDENNAAQCNPVHIYALDASTGTKTTEPSGRHPEQQLADGQITGSPAAEPPVAQIGDGQIQESPASPVNQIGDGQIQDTTASSVSQINDGQVLSPTGTSAHQIGDGYVQPPSGTGIASIGGAHLSNNGSITTPAPTSVPYTGGASIVRNSVCILLIGSIALAFL